MDLRWWSRRFISRSHQKLRVVPSTKLKGKNFFEQKWFFWRNFDSCFSQSLQFSSVQFTAEQWVFNFTKKNPFHSLYQRNKNIPWTANGGLKFSRKSVLIKGGGSRPPAPTPFWANLSWFDWGKTCLVKNWRNMSNPVSSLSLGVGVEFGNM